MAVALPVPPIQPLIRRLPARARPDRGEHVRAGNDNDVETPADALRRAALRLFEHHGLEATRHAHARAEQAFFAGEPTAFRWWLEVTRTLDRKLVAERY